MRTYYWVRCLECRDEWVAAFAEELSFLTPLEENGDRCTDCGGEVEVEDEYEGMAEED